MLAERMNPVHWEWMIYVEMFLAGIAAGAYVTAAMLEVLGRGRSPVARTAHFMVWPLLVVVGILLTVDLGRPERFHHMLLLIKTLLPNLKWWSPMTFGSWGVLLFAIVAFGSFLDALVEKGVFRLGWWNRERTLHGSKLGLVWALVGAGFAFGAGGYSGVLLSVSNLPGWGDSALIGPLFLVTAMVTGMAALLLVQAVRRATAHGDVLSLAEANALLVVVQMVVLVLFIATLGNGYQVFLAGTSFVGMLGAVVLGGFAPLLLRLSVPRPSPAVTALFAVLVLVGGFMLRFAVVMGPQWTIHG
jgi:formate-dependent nitrite reductase membrane component NrfD